jgi:hypothetical protein
MSGDDGRAGRPNLTNGGGEQEVAQLSELVPLVHDIAAH